MNTLNPTVAFIQNYLQEQGLDIQVVEFKESTKTAQAAADVLGCRVDQIAKSIIFRGNTPEQEFYCILGNHKVFEHSYLLIGKCDDIS